MLNFSVIFVIFCLFFDPTTSLKSNSCNPNISRQLQCDYERCDILLTCISGKLAPIKAEKCNKKTPYCTVGRFYDYYRIEATSYACKDNRQFPCSKPGLYPDLTNCQKYFYCHDDDRFVSAKVCPVGYYFNQRLLICAPGQANSCKLPKCHSEITEVIVANPQYYYTCLRSENSYSPMVFKCNKGEIWQNGCFYRCRRAGTFPHDEPNLYYECYRSGVTFKYRIRSCGSKQYNGKLERCDF